MKMTITRTVVEKAAPKKKPYEIRDSRLIGFIIRVQPSGVKTYYCQYRRGARIKIGQCEALSVKTARERVKHILADYYRGGDPALEKSRLKAASIYRVYLEEHYFPWVDANHSNPKLSRQRIIADCAHFLNKRITDITPQAVEKWRLAKVAKGNNPHTANRCYAGLRASLSKAEELGILEDHPLRKMKPLKTDKSLRNRYLSRKEEERLRVEIDKREHRLCTQRNSANEWRRVRRYPLMQDLSKLAFADYLKPMILLSMNTGMRRGEVFSLKWTNVDFEIKQLTIEATNAKSRKTRHIPLNREAMSVLENWREQCPLHAKLVFTNEHGKKFDNIRNSWKKLLEDAFIHEFRWHDLRHHFASRLAIQGANLNTIRELLGHSSYNMTLRYAHLSAGHKAEAVALLDPQTEL